MTDVENLSPLAALRRSTFENGKASRADFSRALAWDGGDSPDYAQLLADIAVDVLVDQADPPQYISAEDVDWLIGEIKGQELSYPTEMRVLTETHALCGQPAVDAFGLLPRRNRGRHRARPARPSRLPHRRARCRKSAPGRLRHRRKFFAPCHPLRGRGFVPHRANERKERDRSRFRQAFRPGRRQTSDGRRLPRHAQGSGGEGAGGVRGRAGDGFRRVPRFDVQRDQAADPRRPENAD
jgi:hypothetical protein